MGTGSAQTESEEKVILVSENVLFLMLGAKKKERKQLYLMESVMSPAVVEALDFVPPCFQSIGFWTEPRSQSTASDTSKYNI